MLDENQKAMACRRLAALTRPLELQLFTPEGHQRFTDALEQVVNDLVGLAPEMLELRRGAASAVSLPQLWVRNVRYLAVPLDRELEPFLDLLLALANGPRRELPTLKPGMLELLVAPTCPNCPDVVRACADVVAGSPELELRIVDVQYFTDLAGGVRSVPTVIVDGVLTLVGPTRAAELAQLMSQRDTAAYMVRAMGSMLEAGRLGDLEPVLQSERGQQALADMMRHGTMQQRMGLLLVAETLLDRKPHALDAAVPHLLPLAEADSPTVRGDTADLLGRIGAPGAREALTRLLGDDNDDVREVAEEALGQLRKPS